MTQSKPRSRAAELNRLLLEELETFVLRHSTRHKISLKVGGDRHFLSRRFLGDRAMTLEEFFATLEALELPPDAFFRALIVRLPEASVLPFLRAAAIGGDENELVIALSSSASLSADAARKLSARLADQGFWGEAIALLERTITTFALRERPDRALLGEVLTEKAQLFRQIQRSGPAIRDFLAAEKLVPESASATRSTIARGLAWSFKETANALESDKWLVQARQHAAPGEKEIEAELLWIQGGIARLKGHPNEAISSFLRAAELAEDLGRPREALLMLLDLAFVFLATKALDRLGAVARRSLGLLQAAKLDGGIDRVVLAFVRDALQGDATPGSIRAAQSALHLANRRGALPPAKKPPGRPRSKGLPTPISKLEPSSDRGVATA